MHEKSCSSVQCRETRGCKTEDRLKDGHKVDGANQRQKGATVPKRVTSYHIPLRRTHHKPGLPLAVSQKKWLKRSLVLKLLSMIAEWEHGAPGLPTHDCGREPLIPCHMTRSPIIPSGSHSTWSKWAKSQGIWTDTLETVDVRSEIRPLTPLIVPTCNKPPLVEDRSRWSIFKGKQRWLRRALMTSLSLTLLIDKWFYPVMLPFPKAKGNNFKPLISQKC